MHSLETLPASKNLGCSLGLVAIANRPTRLTDAPLPDSACDHSVFIAEGRSVKVRRQIYGTHGGYSYFILENPLDGHTRWWGRDLDWNVQTEQA